MGLKMTMDKISTPASYGTSAGTAILGYSVNEFVSLVGLGLAVATFVVNWVYRRREWKLKQAEALRKAQNG